MNIYVLMAIPIIDSIIISAIAAYVVYKKNQTEKKIQVYTSEVDTLKGKASSLLEITIKQKHDIEDARQDATFHYNAFTGYQNSLEERQTSIEGRQSAIEARQNSIEVKHTELSGAHEELHDAIESLHENHSQMSEDFDSISKAITEKSNPVYIQGKGQALCSKCGHNVARYFHDGPSVVCANCDPESYNNLVRG